MSAITPMIQKLSFVLAVMTLAQTSTAHTQTYSSSTYAKASFIPPAAPSSVGWPSTANPARVMNRIATGYGTYRRAADTTAQYSKKKTTAAAGGGGTSSSTKTKPVSKNGKIQVVLLKPVPDLGQTGDVVFVSSAIFQNTLKRDGKARLISEEEVAKLEEEKEEHEKELLEMALQTKKMIEEAMLENLNEQCSIEGEICGVALTVERKAGPEGNLFARVNPKIIIEALKERFPGGAWDGKQVKLNQIKDSEGSEVKKMDIKTTGDYTIDLSLGRGVDVTFIMSMVAE